MTTKKIKTSDILGENYYTYELTSSNYTPALNGTITITCTMKDVYGTAASSKSITLYQNGTSKGAQTTNSSGVATWSITCSNAGLQKFSIKDTSIEVFVDNKSDVGHTHNQYLTNHQDISGKLDKAQTSYKGKNVVVDSSSGNITFEDKNNHTHSQYLTSHQSLDSKTVTVEKLSTATSGYLSSYIVKQNGVQVGNTIDIPKDFLVKSGSVKTVSIANNPVNGYIVGDKYIDLVINTKDTSGTDEHIYILVSDLVTSSIAISDVTNLQTTLNGKIDTAGTGLSKSGTTLNHSNSITAVTTADLKKVKYDAQGHITGTANVTASDLPHHEHSVLNIISEVGTDIFSESNDIQGEIDSSWTLNTDAGTMLFGKILYSLQEDNVFMYDNINSTWSRLATLANIPSLTNYVQKSSTTGLIKNDGTIMSGGTGSSNYAIGNHTHSAYVNPTIADNLTTNNASQVLSAKQGKVLNDTKADKSQVVDWDNITFVSKTDDATGSIILNFLS